jgi:hypothetical protein
MDDMEIKKLNRDEIKERFDTEFNDDNYRVEFRKVMKNVYGDNSVAADIILEELLVEWDNFVYDLKDGYDMSVYEFDNDMDSYRGPIEHLFSNKDLETFEEHRKLKLIVDKIDDKFKGLTIEVNDLSSRDTWWSRRILLKAGDEYFDTLDFDLTPYKIVRT